MRSRNPVLGMNVFWVSFDASNKTFQRFRFRPLLALELLSFANICPTLMFLRPEQVFCELVLIWSSSTSASAAGGESLNSSVLASPVKIQVGSILQKHRSVIDNLWCATIIFDLLTTGAQSKWEMMVASR